MSGRWAPVPIRVSGAVSWGYWAWGARDADFQRLLFLGRTRSVLSLPGGRSILLSVVKVIEQC